MQLELGQEAEPVNPVLLIFSKLGVDRYRDHVSVNLSTIEKLCEECSLRLTLGKQLGGKARWVR